MDTLTLATSIAGSLLGGGVVGAVVSLSIARREARDRGAALELERERWEHEKAEVAWGEVRRSCERVIEALDSMSVCVHRARVSALGLGGSGWGSGDEVRWVYDEANRLNALMPALLTSVQATPASVAPRHYCDRLALGLSTAKHAFDDYLASAFAKRHSPDLFEGFNLAYERASVQYRRLAMKSVELDT